MPTSNATVLLHEIDGFISQIKEIPTTRNYWLIRTQSGQFYDSFKKHNFVAIEHEKISLFDISKILEKTGKDNKATLKALKILAEKKYPEDRFGLIAGQVLKFVVELKKGDIVIIPSENSEAISIGEVSATPILEVTEDQLRKTECPYRKRKSVRWIKDIPRDSLDPFLYRMLQAHQAINNITKYSDIVERTIGNFYIKEKEANLVLEVQQADDINARQLFGLGWHLLDYSQDFFERLGLGLSVDEIEVKINLNSKGKIQFKAPNARTLWLIALITVAINGGGLKIGALTFDLSTDGVIKKVIDYQNSKHDRDKVDSLMQNMKSLKIQSPQDAVQMIQQFSTNKKQN